MSGNAPAAHANPPFNQMISSYMQLLALHSLFITLVPPRARLTGSSLPRQESMRIAQVVCHFKSCSPGSSACPGMPLLPPHLQRQRAGEHGPAEEEGPPPQSCRTKPYHHHGKCWRQGCHAVSIGGRERLCSKCVRSSDQGEVRQGGRTFPKSVTAFEGMLGWSGSATCNGQSVRNADELVGMATGVEPDNVCLYTAWPVPMCTYWAAKILSCAVSLTAEGCKEEE